MVVGTKRELPAQELQSMAQNVIAQNWQSPSDGSWHWVRSSVEAKVARVTLGGQEFYFKAFLSRGLLGAVKSWLRGSRARRFWYQSMALQANGFHVPQIVTAQTGGAAPWVMMESIHGIPWGDYVCSFLTWPQTPERLAWKRKLIAALGAEIGRLHKLGFVHGDLNPFNVLVDANEKEVKFYFIDNERSRQPFYLLDRERVRNLVQINFFRSPHMQHTDLLRFWKAYCNSAGLSQSARQRLFIRACNSLHARMLAKSDYKIFGNAQISAEEIYYLPG